MAKRLNASAPDFAGRFDDFLHAKRAEEEDVGCVVREIIADVQARGDTAVIELSERFDKVKLTPATMRVTQAEIDVAEKGAKPNVVAALKLAASRIEAYHRRQMPADESFTDATGTTLGWRWGALESVGLYVPGGTASYPSSVLMNAVPARVAGVERVVMVTPASGGAINPLTLVAAKIAGVSEIYRVGGAQAIAALAYGTESIKPGRQDRGARATPMSRRPSARSSAASASIPSPGRRKSWSSPTAPTIRPGLRPICSPRPNTTRRRNRS